MFLGAFLQSKIVELKCIFITFEQCNNVPVFCSSSRGQCSTRKNEWVKSVCKRSLPWVTPCDLFFLVHLKLWSEYLEIPASQFCSKSKLWVIFDAPDTSLSLSPSQIWAIRLKITSLSLSYVSKNYLLSSHIVTQSLAPSSALSKHCEQSCVSSHCCSGHVPLFAFSKPWFPHCVIPLIIFLEL